MWFCGTQCFFWRIWAWHPPVGVWIGILGFLGVAVALTRDPTKIGSREKAAWILVISALLFLELKSVYQDRNEHDQQQAEARERETKSFESIADGIEGAIQQSQTDFAATMQKSDAIMGRVGDSIKSQTGGDSFAYITFTAEAGYVHFEEKDPICQQISGSARRDPLGPYFQVAITIHGKYPLRELHATLMDDERRLAAMNEYNEHPEGDWIKAISSSDAEYRCLYLKPQSSEGPTGDVEMLGTYPLPQADAKRLSIAFRSLNGYWIETLHLGLVGGRWHQCLSVMGPTAKQSAKPFIRCDSGWPEGRALAEKDWSSPKPKAH